MLVLLDDMTQDFHRMILTFGKDVRALSSRMNKNMQIPGKAVEDAIWLATEFHTFLQTILFRCFDDSELDYCGTISNPLQTFARRTL